MEKRIQQIQLRKAEIAKEIEAADETRMTELEAEMTALESEAAELRKKQILIEKCKEGQGNVEDKPEERGVTMNEVEERAKKLIETGKASFEARSLLMSGNTVATPEVAGRDINNKAGVGYSSIVDMIDIEEYDGIGAVNIPVTVDGITPYTPGTEGTAVTASDATFTTVTLSPVDINTLSYVSKLVKKSSPADYEGKIKELAGQALRQKFSKAIVDAVKASSLAATKTYTKDTTNGVAIDEDTLREIVFEYGGDEAIEGEAVLFLTKADLQGFGDVRGTNEKKAVYDIIPDTANPNTGVIKDGGLVVPYCLNKNLVTFNGCKSASQKTMIYGNPKAIKGALWGGFDVQIDSSYKFAEGLDTIRGDVYGDADLVVKNGFVIVAIGA